MGRLHLIEILEQPWCPKVVRDTATDYLQFSANVGNHYGVIGQRLRQALQKMNCQTLIDLGSGGGGPWLGLFRKIEGVDGKPIRITLTDKYPNLEAFRNLHERSGEALDFVSYPVDATAVPQELDGFRTLIRSFHHFRPSTAKAILQDAVTRGQGIAIFETTERHPVALLLMLLLSPLSVLTLTPFIRPFRWSRIVLTYVVPAVPFVVLFDGIISCLRSYSESELQSMIASVGGEGYRWEIGKDKIFHLLPIGVTYAVGYPKERLGAG